MHNVYSCIVGIIVRHPISVIIIAALRVVLSLRVAATQLEFHTSRMDLISTGEHYKQLDQIEVLTALRQKLQQHQDLLQELAAAPTLQNLFGLINREITKTLVGHVFTGCLEDEGNEPKPVDLSLLLALLQEMNQGMEGRRSVRSPWERWFTQDDKVHQRQASAPQCRVRRVKQIDQS